MNYYNSINLFLLILLILIAISISLSVQTDVKGGGENSISWINTNIYSPDKIEEMCNEIENSIDFAKPTNLAKLKKYSHVKKLNLNQLVAMRHIINAQKSITASRDSYKYKTEVLNKYQEFLPSFGDKPNINKIETFLQLFPLPPLEVYKLVAAKHKLTPIWYDLAVKNNDNAAILRDAAEFETKLVNYIKTFNVKFKTQEELVVEQTAKFGKPMITPDILFDEPVLINVTYRGKSHSQLIRWIDAKNYTLINIPFIMKKIESQAEKYLAAFGPGALAFHYGFTADIKIDHTLLLDATFL